MSLKPQGETCSTHRRPSSLSFLLVTSCFQPTPTTSGAASWLSSPVNPLLIIGKYSLITDFCTSNFPRASTTGRALLLWCRSEQTQVAKKSLDVVIKLYEWYVTTKMLDFAQLQVDENRDCFDRNEHSTSNLLLG